jgi:hypothetical protein
MASPAAVVEHLDRYAINSSRALRAYFGDQVGNTWLDNVILQQAAQ